MLASLILLAAGAALAPPSALAGAGLGIAPTFPTNATVGDTGLAASLTITNFNTAPEVGATVCNDGDALPCPAVDEGITLIASCGAQGAFSACTSSDTGVFRISSTATGAAGTACAGMSFTVTPIAGDAYGKVRFTPPAGANVLLPSSGTFCRIDFLVDVLAVPKIDAQPGVAGLQTIQVTDATQRSNVGTIGSARGSSTGSTINPPPPVVPPVVPPPVAPPPPPPPAAAVGAVAPCVPPPGPAPAGGELCEVPVRPSSTPSGTVRIAGRSGCVTRNFDVTVRGRQIRRVVFFVDGKRVKSLTRPNRGSRYVLAIAPNALRRGVHRVIATTTFTRASGTRARSLRVVFQRCARAAGAPRFTG